ncbi:MAG: sulfotransferase family 2 domain-containing protein [Pseudomonadota bacterium]
MEKRPVIVHFHLFKNAGTSVDRILQNNFGEGEWAEIEGPDNKKLDPAPLVEFIRENPALKAVSSHTAVVSVPEYDDIELLPIFFVRHPIDRIRSAYDFERKQDADTPGAKRAKEGDFESYLDWRLSTPAPFQVTNFHAARLKDFHEFTPARQQHLFLPRAKTAMDALPFIGIVEDFDASMARFAEFLRPYFPEFKASSERENTTAPGGHSLNDNLTAFKNRIGADVYAKLEQINEIDFELYELAKEAAKVSV